MLVLLWKIIRALFVAGRLCWLINMNRLTTSVRDKIPAGQKSDLVLIAFSFGTEIGGNSINISLAKLVLAALEIDIIKTIILQEEVYQSLLTICPNPNLRGKELTVIEYGDREYLNSCEVASEALKLANCQKVFIVSHNHMFVRVSKTIEALGATVSGYMTAMGYDTQADQSRVRSNRAFALYEPAAYLYFVAKGYI